MRRTVTALAVGLAVGLALTMVWVERARRLEQAQAEGVVEAEAGPEAEDERGTQRPVDRQAAVTVHVVREGRGAPGASVSFAVHAGTRWLPVGRERTDAAGNFSFPGRPGRYAFFVVTSDGASTIDMKDVAWSRQPSQLELVVGAMRAVRGQVVEHGTKRPIAAASVVWVPRDQGHRLPADFSLATAADGLGRFSLQVPKDTVGGELTASAPGYSPEQRTDDDDPSTTTITLEPAAVVLGEVVNGAGAPVSGATVSARPAQAMPRTTDEVGRFQLEVRAGGCTVGAVSPAGEQALARLTLAPGERKALRLVLDPGTNLEGRVVNQEKAPLEGADVRVLAEPDDVEVARVTSSAEGRFVAFNLPRGRYSVSAETATHATGRQVGIEHPGDTTVEVTVNLPGSLSGTVRNAAGAPLGAATLTVEYPYGRGLATVKAYTDEAGRYEVEDLQAGQLTVTARYGEAAELEQSLYLVSGSAQTVDFTLGTEPLGVLTGTVKGPPQKWRLAFYSPTLAGAGKNVTTNEVGEYTVRLAPGMWRVVLLAETNFHEQRPVMVAAGETTTYDPDAPQVVDGGFGELHIKQLAFGERSQGIAFDNAVGGVQVGFLASQSKAAEAGVQSGDVVVAIGGEPVRDSLDAFAKMRGSDAELTLTLRRDGVERTVTLK